MRVGVYNRYWNTFGGGEKHVGAIAATLAAQPGIEVTLIGTEPFSAARLAERFHLDLERCRSALWPKRPCEELAPLSAGYDLFINSTYCSSMPAAAQRAVYLCFFPQELGATPSVVPGRHIPGTGPCPIAGHHQIDPAGRYAFGASGVVRIPLASKRPRFVSVPMATAPDVAFRHMRVAGASLPWSTNHGEVQIDIRSLDLPPDSTAIDLFFETSVHAGTQTADGSKSEMPGVFLNISDDPVRAGIPPDTPHPDWLSTYDTIVANSEYTEGWIRRRWGRDSVVLPPPIDTTVFRPPAPGTVRRPTILSVGRFFAGSHNKKHDVLIETFREMIDTGRLDRDWELHLVGSRHRELPQHIEYYERLVRLAEGYPIRFSPISRSRSCWRNTASRRCIGTPPDSTSARSLLPIVSSILG
jgi:glycosyltransferase involved in cell wall biosynthesis